MQCARGYADPIHLRVSAAIPGSSARGANAMRFHYDFRCSPWNAVLTEVIATDINGAIVKHEFVEAPVRYVTSHDAIATRVFETFCGVIPERG